MSLLNPVFKEFTQLTQFHYTLYEKIEMENPQPVGAGNAWGPESSISPSTGYYSLVPFRITAVIGGTVGTSETIYARAMISRDDGTSRALLQKNLAAGATGSLTWTLDEILGGFCTGCTIIRVSVEGTSDKSSTSATIYVISFGMQLRK